MIANAKIRITAACNALLLIAFVLLAAGVSANEVTIAWDANTEPDLAGYNIYFGEVSTTPQKLNVANRTSTTLTDLQPGKTYFFYATAYNTAGLESEPSDQITYFVNAEPASDTVRVSTPVVAGNGSIVVSGSGIPGLAYLVQAADRLDQAEWTVLGAATAAADGLIRIEDSVQGRPMRFYRVVQVN